MALLVYDISNKKTFQGLDIYIRDIRSHDPEIPIFIIGNNYEKENERQVTFDEAKEFSVSRKTKYFIECSAKTGYNVEKIFYEAAKYLYSSEKELNKKYKNSNQLKIGMDNEENYHKKSLLNEFFYNKLKIGKDNNKDNNHKKVEKNKILSEFSSNYIMNKYRNF